MEDVGANAYQIAGIFDEHWYDSTMEDIGKNVEVEALSTEEQGRWNKALSAMLLAWAEELEGKGLMAKKALLDFKTELNKVGVAFNSCPISE